MLRYFYFIVCIHPCFCYEYTEGNQNKQFRDKNENINGIQGPDPARKSKVVQFDVSSFIGNSPVGNVKDYGAYAYRNNNRDNRRTQSEDYYEAPINEIKKKNVNTDYLNNIDSVMKDASADDLIPEDEVKLEPNFNFDENLEIEHNIDPYLDSKVKQDIQNELNVNNLAQNPEKKCAFRNMKVPFFSHKKSTAKKEKKRRLFCFNCAQTSNSDATQPPKIKQKNGKAKRSYGNLCPRCIKKILKRQGKVKRSNAEKINVIHDSREFYQFSNGASAQDPTEDQDKISTISKDNGSLNTRRVKRLENKERERQLIELAEVEKKIDSVKIKTPQFDLNN